MLRRLQRPGALPAASAAPLALALVLLCGGLLAGCTHEMVDQPHFKPLAAAPLLPHGQEAQPLVPGTIARGHWEQDTPFYTGMQNGVPVTTLPVPLTAQLLQRGQQRFDIYCTPCHSLLGDGEGIVVRRGFTRPPSFHTPYLRQAPMGHFFDVISHGWGAMPDYRQQIPPADRWAIVAYIRALQASQDQTVAAVPANQRRTLNTTPAPPAPVFGRRGLHEALVPRHGHVNQSSGLRPGKEQP